MEMENADLPSQSRIRGENWEVFRDAFVPPTDTRRPKPWERAPVQGHAPRLQGQKIWKKAGIRIHENKENGPVSLELQLEGKGARKKMKIEGSKENIGDAPWKTASISPVKNTATSTRGDTDCLEGRGEEALQFVPRKRTNTNHVITPRKPLRQTTLNGHAQTQAIGSPGAPAEKPVRRRKSMRKSIRKSTVPVLSDAPPDPVLLPATSESTQTPIQDPTASHEANAEAVLPTVDKSPKQASDPLHVESAAAQPEPRLDGETSNTYQTIKSVVKIPLNDRQEESAESAGDSSAGNPNNGYIPKPATYDELATETENEIQQTIEEEAETERPVKVMETLKKRKGAGVRRGTRRSTRNTRASSAKAEEQPAAEVALDVSADAQPLEQAVTEPVNSEAPPSDDAPPRSTRKTRASSTKVEEQPGTAIALPVTNDVQPLEQPVVTELVEAKGVSDVVLKLITSEAATGTTTQETSEDIKLDTAIEVAEPKALGEQSPTPFQVEQSAQEKMPVIASIEPAEVETPQLPLTQNELAPEEIQLHADVVEFTMIAQAEAHTAESGINTDVEKAVSNDDAVEQPQIEPQTETLEQGTEAIASQKEYSSSDSSPVQFSPDTDAQLSPAKLDYETLKVLFPLNPDDETLEVPEVLEPTLTLKEDDTLSLNMPNEVIEDLPETSTPDPSTSELVEAILENAPVTTYDHDDTDMLRNFLTRVKANKAAKAEKATPKRKRSLPHSPLRLPLGEADSNLSPSSPDEQPKSTEDEFDVGLPTSSPTKRRKKNDREQDAKEPTRRSTRLPVIKTPLGAPSFIPVRRLNQDGDTTVTLRRNEEKELAALTRVNTRKNKGGALSAAEVLRKKAEEKDDPALRQRFLKEVFDEKAKLKSEKRKSVVWAEELAQFQTLGAGMEKKDVGKETETGVKGEKKSAPSVKVGVKRKIALGNGITGNGTPALKRRIREKA